MNRRKLSKNLIITVFSYAFLLIVNVFASKIVLDAYGSEINGLLASTGQVFAYVALLEAGIGTATITALYKPLAEKDDKTVNQVYSASVAYYRTVLKWYLLCVVLVSFLWPLTLDANIGYWTIFGVIFIQGISNAFTFYFVSTTTNYLLASGKNYINVYAHLAITLMTYLVKAVIAICGANIVLMSISLLAVNLLKCGFYLLYKKIACKEIKIERKVDRTLLKQRNSFLIHEISGCIFSATDLILISIFCDLKMASVYAVYAMVFTSLSGIISQGFNSSTYVLGDAYSRKEGYEKTHDRFNAVYIAIVFCLYTVAYLLVNPFVGLYTSGVKDIVYVNKYLPILFVCIQLLSSCRIVDNALIKNARHAKQTISRTIAESAINLVVSIVLVNFIDIYGVLIGTIVALLYRTNDMILYANKKILERSAWKEYGLYLLNGTVFALFAGLNYFVPILANGYLELIWKGILVFFAVASVYCIINALWIKNLNRNKHSSF